MHGKVEKKAKPVYERIGLEHIEKTIFYRQQRLISGVFRFITWVSTTGKQENIKILYC